MNSQSQLTYPIPPDFLMQQILGPKATSEGYLYGGYVVSAGIRRILRLVGRRFQDFKYVLDFGCGCARVLRWFHDLPPSSAFYGTDISQEAINWCKENISFVKFTKTILCHRSPSQMRVSILFMACLSSPIWMKSINMLGSKSSSA